MRRLPLLAALGAAFLLVASPGSTACDERRSVLGHLAARYGEQPAGLFLRPDGAALELLLDRSDGSWSILLSSSDGRSCLIGAGWDLRLQEVEHKPIDEEAV